MERASYWSENRVISKRVLIVQTTFTSPTFLCVFSEVGFVLP